MKNTTDGNKVGNLVMMSPEEIEKAQKRLKEKEKNSVENGSSVGVVGENKNLWDFDFGGETTNTNTNSNTVGTTSNNPNILDFDFIAPSNPIPTMNTNPISTINSNPIPQQTVNNPSSTGSDFTFESTTNPIPTAQSNPIPITQPQQPLFDFQTDTTVKTPSIQTSIPNTTTQQNTNQDILSFFQ